MMKSFPQLAAGALAAVVLLASGPSAQAGLIPWTYNAIFGPVGSTFAPRGANYRGAYYGGYAPAAVGGACNTCNYGVGYGYRSNYYAGYAPVYGSSYGVSYGNACGCSPCATGNCVGGCATGNCSSYSPATGTTSAPTPATTTPTQTFQSSKPTVNPEAEGTNNGGTSTYDEDGYQMPKQPEDDSSKTDAPSFSPFGSNSNESMKIPSTDAVPVEKRKPAPTELEGNGLKLPSLRFQPAPVAVDETSVSFRTPTRTRTVRTARYNIPQVARQDAPATPAGLLPPLPSPVQLAGN